MSSLLNLFDVNRPHDGAVVKGQEIRELLKSVATMNAGTEAPGKVASLLGDARFSVVSVAVNYRLRLEINSVDRIIDLRTVATNNLVTPANVVTAINTAFGTTYAYVYNNETFDGTAFIAIVAAGTDPYITVKDMADGTDAGAKILGVAGRNAGVPYTVSGVDSPFGLLWYETGTSDSIRMKLGSPARATGTVNLSKGVGTVNLSARPFLRIRILGPNGAVFGPLTIDVKGANPSATQPSEIVTAINAAFTALPGWPNVGSGPARLVTKEVGSNYLEVVSGPVASPFTGPSASVEISPLAVGGPIGVNFLIDDAVTDLFGLPRGEEGRVSQRVPHVFTGADFSSSFIRGVTSRSGPGIGSWGPAMESAKDIPADGSVDGEIRIAKDTGILWVYRQGQFGFDGDGWRRAVPGSKYPIVYSKALESYQIKTTSDTFIPQPLSRVAYNISPTWPVDAGSAEEINAYVTLDSNTLQTGQVGDAVALVDAKDFIWKVGPYTGGRNFYQPSAVWDNFPTARYKLGRTREGADWRLVDSNTPAITGTNNQRLRPIGGNIASTAALGASSFTALRAYCDSAGSSGYYVLPIGSTVNHTFTIPNVLGYTPVKQGSFSIRVVPSFGNASNTTSSTEYTYFAYDNGAGVISGTGITGTINYTTGVVSITTSVALDYTLYAISYSYAQANFQVVCVDVRKDPNGETRVANGVVESAEAGIIYNAIPGQTGSGYVAIVRDDGTGQISTIQSGTPVSRGVFAVDPPLDTTWRTLRIVLAITPEAITHYVFWNGSNKPTDWVATENFIGDAPLTSNQTNGGNEVDQRGRKIAAIVSYPPFGGLDPNEGGYFAGLWAKGTIAGSGYAEKIVQFRNFQNHSGSRIPFNSSTPALPPVSGIRLRDTINAIQVKKNGTLQVSPVSVISDCNANTPLVINLAGDIATSQGSGLTGQREIGIGLYANVAISNKEQRFLSQDLLIPGKPGYLSWNVGGNDQQNVYGRTAFWSLGKVLVDDTYAPALAGTFRSVSAVLADSPFWFKRYYDGSGSTTLGSAIITSKPSAYWDPDVISSGTGISGPYYYFPGVVVPTAANAFNWRYAISNFVDIHFGTTLPADDYNGLSWHYHVTRAQVVSVRSSFLEAVRSGWTQQTIDNGTDWGVLSPYPDPVVSEVEYAPNIGSKWARFRVRISYYGPVVPIGLHLDIMATRMGVSSS